jgi:hypothetical protein
VSKSKSKPPKRQRKFNVGILSSEGYWSNGIQKVVKKWRPRIGEKIFDENITSLLISCHYFVTRNDFIIHRKRFAIELALAIDDVCEKWKGEFGERILDSIIHNYITERLGAITKIDDHLQPIFGVHKRLILDLLLAVDNLWHTNNLDRWILELGFSGDGSDYENDVPVPRSYKKMQKLIKARGGPYFEEKAISKRAERLKLT